MVREVPAEMIREVLVQKVMEMKEKEGEGVVDKQQGYKMIDRNILAHKEGANHELIKKIARSKLKLGLHTVWLTIKIQKSRS